MPELGKLQHQSLRNVLWSKVDELTWRQLQFGTFASKKPGVGAEKPNHFEPPPNTLVTHCCMALLHVAFAYYIAHSLRQKLILTFTKFSQAGCPSTVMISSENMLHKRFTWYCSLLNRGLWLNWYWYMNGRSAWGEIGKVRFAKAHLGNQGSAFRFCNKVQLSCWYCYIENQVAKLSCSARIMHGLLRQSGAMTFCI